MGGFSGFWENKILDHLTSKSTYTPPTIFVALSGGDPGEDASGMAEPSGNAYARTQTSASDWTDCSGGIVENTNEITFPMATGTWGTMTHFALYDAATDGNMLAYGELSSSKAIYSGDIPRFAAGELVITLD